MTHTRLGCKVLGHSVGRFGTVLLRCGVRSLCEDRRLLFVAQSGDVRQQYHRRQVVDRPSRPHHHH